MRLMLALAALWCADAGLIRLASARLAHLSHAWQPQLDVLDKAKASMEKNVGVTLSFSQVLTVLAVRYIKEE